MNLSVVIITFNEEKNIERCLNSVKEVADEIIVLDSFSTDKTEEICKKHNVKFFQHKFDGHIQQKNRAVSLAENDYVLSLDADEELSLTLSEEIKKVKKKYPADAYFFNRLNFFCGKPVKYGGWYPDKKIRLWNKNKGEWGGINPHDTVILKKNATKNYLTGNLLHYSYNSIDEYLTQANKFSTISAKELVKRNKKHLYIKAVLSPLFKFFKNYFLKLGFIGGYTGFMISAVNAFETFMKYSKAIYYNKKQMPK